VKGLPGNEYFILAKPHPKGNLPAEDYTTILGNKGRAVADINVLDAIELADCVVSINSTVAFEAALRAKPVLLLGQGVLSKKEFVSSYLPEKGAAEQIAACITRYNLKRSTLHQQALSFAVYLDSQYYIYRGNQQKTVDLVKRLLEQHDGGKEKSFTVEDVARLSHKEIWEGGKERFLKNVVSLHDLKNCISGTTLLKALYEKVKDKILTNSYLLFL
jgi:CDP-glycerol glycerophosphotransferase (TagB/SpsB family)